MKKSKDQKINKLKYDIKIIKWKMKIQSNYKIENLNI
jgi:hypothetical protein